VLQGFSDLCVAENGFHQQLGKQNLWSGGTLRIGATLYPTQHDGPFALELVPVPVSFCLFGVFQTSTCVTFQHSMLSAEMLLAESAVTHNGLRRRFAWWMSTAWFV